MYWMKRFAFGLMLSMKPIDLPLSVSSRRASVARATAHCPTGLTSFTVFAAVIVHSSEICRSFVGFLPADHAARPHHRRVDIKHRRDAEPGDDKPEQSRRDHAHEIVHGQTQAERLARASVRGAAEHQHGGDGLATAGAESEYKRYERQHHDVLKQRHQREP